MIDDLYSKPVSNYVYTPYIQSLADQYAREFESLGDVVPTIQSLALFIGVPTRVAIRWADGRFPEFQLTVEIVEQKQHAILVNKGLLNKTNSSITKLMLNRHGYSDRVQNEVSNPDGSLQINRGRGLNEFYEDIESDRAESKVDSRVADNV